MSEQELGQTEIEETQTEEVDEDDGSESPYAPLARDMGWRPKSEYDGPNEWKDAETFIREGREIQQRTSTELKAVRAQLDTVAKTSASIVQQQVEERVAKLAQQYQQAVDDGDPAAAYRLSRQIDQTMATPVVQTPSGPPPEAQAFAERNATWFNKPGNEYATARAVELTNTLAAQGYDHATQLRIAEQRLRQEMPQLFGQTGKPPAGVNSPNNRSSGGGRRESFADMPKAAQDVARDMAERGVIPDVNAYVKNYFANQKARV